MEFENEEYAAILNEYRDGLLIFDVMDKNIWQKGKNDSLGIQEYYNKTKQNYQWKQRINATIYSAISKAVANQVQQMLNEGKTAEEIKAAINADNQVNVLITPGTYEIGQRELPENLTIKTGVSEIYPNHDSFLVLNIEEVIPPGPKALEEVKGKVLSNYQNDIEAQWMDSLHKKYKVEVNKKALKHVKKDLK
jgi:peptidyl-prolyl cis-trans isomerase SurA